MAPAEKSKLLARWSHAATVDARATYIPQTEGVADPVRLRAFNELQHRIAGQLGKLLQGDDDRYPDDVFLLTVLEFAKQLHADLLSGEIDRLAGMPGGTKRRAG